MAVLYSLAAITPDTEFGLSFYDYFTEEERFALWRVASLREYLPKVADPYYDREDSAPIAATKSPVCRT